MAAGRNGGNGADPSPERQGANRDRPNARGEATRLEILRKAEELFAERGITVVPLRDIGIAAGQKNNVAVQYHFGDRESLVREISRYRAESSERIRSDLLAQLLSRDEAPTVRDLVEIFFASLASHLEDPENHYLAFLSRYAVAYGDYEGLRQDGSTSSLYTMAATLRRLLPEVPEDLVEERWMVMMTSAVHTLARYQTRLRAGQLGRPMQEFVDDLVAFFTAGITAPSAAPN